MSDSDPGPSVNPGAQILTWMHEEFTAVRRQLHELAERAARHEDSIRELADRTSSELSVSLAQMEGYAAELRNETARLAAFQDELVDSLPDLIGSAVAPQVRASVTDPLPGLVGEAVRPELREAMGELKRSMAGLRAETAGLQAWRAQLMVDLPEIVAQALSRAGPPAAVPAPAVRPAAASAAPAIEAEPSPAARPPRAPTAAPTRRSVGRWHEGAGGRGPALVAGPTLAGSVVAALEQARLRLRQRRRAGIPAPGLRRQDPFLGQAVRALVLLDDRSGTARAPGLAPAELPFAEREDQELALALDEWPGLVVAGPAAVEAVRSMVVTFLALHEASEASVLVTAGLLPVSPSLPGLERVTDLEAVLEDLTVELHRRRAAGQGGAGSTENGGGAEPAGEAEAAAPLLLLATTDPAPDDLSRLRWLAENGGPHGILVVAAAPTSPGGTGVEVGASGDLGSVEPQELAWRLAGARAFRMSTESAGELLSLLAAARTDGDQFRRVRYGDAGFSVPDAPRSQTRVEVDVLGGYRLLADTQDITGSVTTGAAALAALLALHPDGMEVEAVGQALWPGAGDKVVDLLQEAVDGLAATSSSAGGAPGPAGVPVERQGRRVVLGVGVDSDLWRLQRVLADAASEPGSAGRAERYEHAVDLYQGDLLEGCGWLWARAAQDDLRQRMVDVLVWLADTHWAAGDADRAARALGRALEIEPYAEQLYRRQMRLHARRGRLDEVDRAFEQMRVRLTAAGLEPSAETEKLRVELAGSVPR